MNVNELLDTIEDALEPVSYTHLDVYKRQAQPLIGQRREVIPPRIAAGHAVQYAARLGVAAIGHKIAGGTGCAVG